MLKWNSIQEKRASDQWLYENATREELDDGTTRYVLPLPDDTPFVLDAPIGIEPKAVFMSLGQEYRKAINAWKDEQEAKAALRRHNEQTAGARNSGTLSSGDDSEENVQAAVETHEAPVAKPAPSPKELFATAHSRVTIEIETLKERISSMTTLLNEKRMEQEAIEAALKVYEDDD